MDELLGVARFTFHEGGAEEFKRLSARCVDIVRTQDTGTLEYRVYLSEDESSAVVIERYRDAAALAEHTAHLGEELFDAILATADVEGETLGRPTPELRDQLAGSEVRLLVPFLTM